MDEQVTDKDQAVVSLLWSLATTISARRAAHHRPSIPSRIQLPVQTVVAGGATACLALLAVHLANSDWMRYNSLQGGMIALLAIITYIFPHTLPRSISVLTRL